MKFLMSDHLIRLFGMPKMENVSSIGGWVEEWTYFRMKWKGVWYNGDCMCQRLSIFQHFPDRNETSKWTGNFYWICQIAGHIFRRKFTIPSDSNRTFFIIICFVIKFLRMFENPVFSDGALVHSKNSPQINKHKNPHFIWQTPFSDIEQVFSFLSPCLCLIPIQYRTATVHTKDAEHTTNLGNW